MATYESYKDSGVKWLGQIPSHWEVKSLRNFLRPFSERNHPDKQLLSVTRDKGVIVRGAKGEDDNHNVIPEDLSGYKHVLPGDFVINKMKSWQGSYGVSDFEGIVSPAYFTYHLDFANERFFSLALRSSAYIPFFMQFSKGIRVDQWDLTPDALKTIPFFLPSPDEQEAIVVYLDKVTGNIDRAIEAQQKMIDALNERKQIIITRAVTRGLNPDAPLSDSGIDWLGQIPEHWEIRKLKWLIDSPLQYGANESPDDFSESLPRYIRITDIASDGTLKKDGAVSLAWNKASKYILTKGDILFARSGATVGKTYLFLDESTSCFAGYLIKAQCNSLILPEFLVYYTQSSVYENWKNYIFNKATIQNIGADKYSTLLVPLPLVDEQRIILEKLKNDLTPIKQAILNCERMISLLQERKQIIINEVVIGKTKVI